MYCLVRFLKVQPIVQLEYDGPVPDFERGHEIVVGVHDEGV